MKFRERDPMFLRFDVGLCRQECKRLRSLVVLCNGMDLLLIDTVDSRFASAVSEFRGRWGMQNLFERHTITGD